MTLQENVKMAIKHGLSVIEKYDDGCLRDLNETTTRYAMIDPILRALGWKLDDPERCRYEEWWGRKELEYSGRPDYCLYKNANPVVLIEAKALSKALNGFKEEKQLFNYDIEPVPKLWVLTNGCHWYFYDHKTQRGKHRNPNVDMCDQNCTTSEMAQTLIQNLSSRKRW